MKEILEMKRTHDRLYKKRMARMNHTKEEFFTTEIHVD